MVVRIAEQAASEVPYVGAAAGGLLSISAKRDFRARSTVGCELYGLVAVLRLGVGMVFPVPLMEATQALREHLRQRAHPQSRKGIDPHEMGTLDTLGSASDEVSRVDSSLSSGAAPTNLARSCEVNAQLEALKNVLAELRPDLRIVRVFREIDGMSYEEIAQLLSVTSSTVRGRLSRVESPAVESVGDSNECGADACEDGEKLIPVEDEGAFEESEGTSDASAFFGDHAQSYLDLIRSFHDEWDALEAASDLPVMASPRVIESVMSAVRAKVRR